MVKILVTGIHGQDGSFLARDLLQAGHEVTAGISAHRESSRWRLRELKIENEIRYVSLDYTNHNHLRSKIEEVEPQWIFNLAGQSSVAKSFRFPDDTFVSNYTFPRNLLHLSSELNNNIRFLQASTSEIFSEKDPRVKNENSEKLPRNPYGFSKLKMHLEIQKYRMINDIFACNAILFNHESELRGRDFATSLVAQKVARVSFGEKTKLTVGNLDIVKDWGYAPEYVTGMIKMLEHSEPVDLVLASGVGHTLREFCSYAFSLINRNYQDFIEIDPLLIRVEEPSGILGSSSRAKKEIDWQTQIEFKNIIEKMVDFELRNGKIG